MQLYVVPTGQVDNIGDSVLRATMLDSLRPLAQLHVYPGQNRDYIAGLRLRAEDVVYSSKTEWLAAALRAGTRGDLLLALNAGELVQEKHMYLDLAWETVVGLVGKTRGGAVISIGMSLRDGTARPVARYFGYLLRGAAVVAWRDRPSADLAGSGEVGIDWAFLSGASDDELATPTARGVIAVSMRADRPVPGQPWFTAVLELASRNRCRVVVVTQVARDASRSAQLAEMLGADLVDWEFSDHLRQEALIRGVYRESLAIVSDRIHALIIGMTEGAVPVGATTGNPEKVSRTFAPVTAVAIGFHESELDPEHPSDRMQRVLDAKSELFADLATARSSMTTLVARVEAAVNSRTAGRAAASGRLAATDHTVRWG